MESKSPDTPARDCPWYVYMLHCEDGSLYTGITTEPARRMREHLGLEPGGARYTRVHHPDALVALWATDTRSSASKAEFAIKKLKHADKIRLVRKPEYAESVVEEASLSTISARERRSFWPL